MARRRNSARLTRNCKSSRGSTSSCGWSLDREVLEFLLSTGAFVDVDEYG
jgi:hypothetical protein